VIVSNSCYATILHAPGHLSALRKETDSYFIRPPRLLLHPTQHGIPDSFPILAVTSDFGGLNSSIA
jgi:hypothetical protein